MLQMAVIVDTEGPATSVTFGDDVVSVSTHIDGTVDDIKLELELLSAVGEVSKQHCRFVAGKNRVDIFLVPEILCLSFSVLRMYCWMSWCFFRIPRGQILGR